MLYQLQYIKHHEFKKTLRKYYVIIDDPAILNQFALDEEKRAGLHVYLRPVVDEELKLELYSQVACIVPDDKTHTINIYTEKETTSEQLH